MELEDELKNFTSSGLIELAKERYGLDLLKGYTKSHMIALIIKASQKNTMSEEEDIGQLDVTDEVIAEGRGLIFSIYLVAVFLNAFVDLGHKIIIQNTIFMIYGEQQQIILTAVVNAMILVPFILLFTVSGYLSDKFAKTRIMRYSAFSAVLITLAITYCYYNGLYQVAFGFTLLLATQSAIYSPAKMGYIKECLSKAGLSKGNAFHSSVVLIAILMGTVFFSYLFEAYLGAMQATTPEEILMKIAPVGWVLVGLSTVEFIATLGTRFYPTKLITTELSISKLVSFNYLATNFKAMRSNEIVWYTILGTAIFWGMSQNLVAVIPAHAKVNFGVESPLVVNAMLASSVIGIMIGAFLSGRKSLNFIRINNIYTGSIMITVCAILVPVISSLSFIPNSTALILVTSVILLFGVGAGMMIIPLNSLMQAHSPEDRLGSMLAGKNWLQNIAMIGLLALTMLLAKLSFDSQFILYLNAAIAVVGFTIVLKKLKTIL